MAVPTISSVTPGGGLARGYNVVSIAGTNFRTRAVVYTIPLLDLPNTVRVTVNGRVARAARAISSTQIDVLVPEYRGLAQEDPLPAVDVIVSNLDDSGIVIPGETATSVGAYTYERAALRLPAGDPPFLRVMTELIRLLQRGITINVGWLASSDYGEEGASVCVVQEHPTVGIRMDALRDSEYGHLADNEHQLKALPGGGWDRYKPPETYMLVFDLILASNNPVEAHHMLAEVLQIWQDNQLLVVDGDPAWSTDENEYPLEMPTRGTQASAPNNNDVVAFSCQLRVRGVPVLADEPIGQVHEITNIIIASSSMAGVTFQTSEI